MVCYAQGAGVVMMRFRSFAFVTSLDFAVVFDLIDPPTGQHEHAEYSFLTIRLTDWHGSTDGFVLLPFHERAN